MENVGIILAGGIGKRMGFEIPKQLLRLKNKPLFLWALDAFLVHPEINRVIFVYNKNFLKEIIETLRNYNLIDRVELVEGGNERQVSSYNALCYLEGQNVGNVLIHDSARPLVSEKLISDVISNLRDCEACVPVVELKESICSVEGENILRIEDRKKFKIVQTPQGFNYETILSAHKLALKEGIKNSYDDSSLVLRVGKTVKWINGDPLNIKITYREDLKFAEFFMKLHKAGDLEYS